MWTSPESCEFLAFAYAQYRTNVFVRQEYPQKWGSLETAEDFHLFYSHAKFEANFSGINTMSRLLPVLLRRNAALLPKRLAEVVGTIKTAEFGNFGECLVTVDQYHGFP